MGRNSAPARTIALTAKALAYLSQLDNRAGRTVRVRWTACPRCGNTATAWGRRITCTALRGACPGNGMPVPASWAVLP